MLLKLLLLLIWKQPFLLQSEYLKVVSTIFLLLCFLVLKESTWKARKNILFHLKSSFRSQENQFLEVQVKIFHYFIKFLSRRPELVLNNLGSKQSVNEIWSVYAILQKTFCKNCDLKSSPKPFWDCKELGTY